MPDYIYPAPGVSGAQITVLLQNNADTLSDSLTLSGFQDVTINAANDTFTWEQLDSASKKQIATTATNSVSMNLVVNQTKFFGADPDSTTTTDTMSNLGVFGASRLKSLVEFDIYLGDQDDGTAGLYVYGKGYITGLAPTVSATEPVWVTPVTISVTGDYTVGAAATLT